MKFLKILRRAFCDLVLIILFVVLISPLTSFHGDFAEAEEFDEASIDSEVSYPYTRTFTISAYYSPLPCQNKYVTGSYDGDINLNGSGVNGADGTPVYPGMIAAPSSYDFGTKMYIPTVGIVGVHDRGGAIVASNGVEGVYDRLDIWMGYGDQGLERALNWGKRSIEVTVYGVNDSIIEDVGLDDYSSDESVPNDCVIERPEVIIVDEPDPIVPTEEEEQELIEEIVLSNTLSANLGFGDEGGDVLALQNELNRLNFYKSDLNSVYDEVTEHAVYKFQQSQYLVADESSAGAGIFGPKTRDRLNEIISARNYTKVLVAKATTRKLEEDEAIMVAADDDESDVAYAEKNVELDDGQDEDVADPIESDVDDESQLLTVELDYGAVSNDVKKLQEFLKSQGYFTGLLTTTYYGPVTEMAVIEFQLANDIISSEDNVGAGRVGPATLQLINKLYLNS